MYVVELISYCDSLLNIASFNDYCVNGLQVEGSENVTKIVTGVSCSERLFNAAIARKADAVLVHHGLFWRNTQHPLALTGILGRRVKLLHQHNISLLAYHLPLDAHSEFGNNALIAKALELSEVQFVPLSDAPNPFAAVGNLEQPLSCPNFFTYADEKLETSGLGLAFTKQTINRICVISGGGSGYYPDAVKHGADVLVTGELKEDVVRSAEEAGIALYAAGHYNSEKWGVRALGEHLQSHFGIDVDFVDIPNPI